jgi:hypothetical protein
MPLSVCEPYAWYLVVTCKRCRVRQALHRDTSQGKSALLRSYKWRCIQCHYVATYAPSEIERYQTHSWSDQRNLVVSDGWRLQAVAVDSCSNLTAYSAAPIIPLPPDLFPLEHRFH